MVCDFRPEQLRIVLAVAQQGAVYEVPVDEECALQRVDGAACHAYHGIAPSHVARSFLLFLSSAVNALHIAQRYVHAADETRGAVDDDELAVVAVVHLAGERREANGQERCHFDALFAHAFKEAVSHLPAAHVVVDDAYFHTLPDLGDEGVADQVAQGVVLEDVDVNVYVALCLGYSSEQCREELVSVGVDLRCGVLERQRQVLTDKQVDELAVLLGQLQVLLPYELQHRALGQLIHRTLAHQLLLAGVHTKEEIEDDAHKGYEPDDECPCRRLCRLAVVHQHAYDRHDDNDVVDNEQDELGSWHRL